MLNKKTIATTCLALTLGMTVNTSAYADNACGKYTGKAIHVLIGGLVKQATKACKKGDGEVAEAVNEKKLGKILNKGVKILQKGLDKNGPTCLMQQAEIDLLATADLAPGAQGLADDLCANPPQCANGIDDDEDGFIDFAGGDAECVDAADIDEAA